MFRGYVSGYVTGYVSRECNPCALLKPEPSQKKANPYESSKILDGSWDEGALLGITLNPRKLEHGSVNPKP